MISSILWRWALARALSVGSTLLSVNFLNRALAGLLVFGFSVQGFAAPKVSGEDEFAFRFETQKPEDSFANGVLPSALERMANQRHELRSESIRIREAQDAVNRGLPVAIVDTGMDLAHPDLVPRIRFRFQDERVNGAGLDVMGGDSFASANLVSPRLFAFGAKDIVDGKIVDPPENPLGLLEELNLTFVDRFIAAIKTHPVLKDSMFAKKLNRNNFTLLGAHLFLANNDFDRMRYEAFKTAGLLLNDSIRTRLTGANYRGKIHPLDLHYVVDQEWRLDPETGLPFMPTINESPYSRALLKIEHSDLFYQLLVQEFNEFSKTSGYGPALGNFLRYVSPREFPIDLAPKTKMNVSLKYLAKARYYHALGAQSVDPMVETLRMLEWFFVLVNAKAGNISNGPIDVSKESLSSSMGMILEIYKVFMDYFESFPMKSAYEERMLRKIKAKFPTLSNLMTWYFFDRMGDTTRNLVGSGVPILPRSDATYRRLLHRTAHPYLSSEPPSSHGTHVAGITAAQDPKITIEPIRIGLGPLAVNHSEVANLSAKFRTEFLAFLTDPVVFRAVASELSDHIAELRLNDESLANRARVAQILMRGFEERIRITTEFAPSFFTFLTEITAAIKHIGDQRITVANMSLGGSYDDRAFRPSTERGGRPELERDIDNLYAKMLTEYRKFAIAKAITEYAPNTLFVMAAGNDGSWIDGSAKVSMPVELTSRYMEAFERPAANEVMLNNQVHNVLAVGSLSPRNNLSSYSNFLLNDKTPMVFIQGEHILSPVRSVDPSAVVQALNDRLPELLYFAELVPTDRRFVDFWSQVYKGLGSSMDPSSEDDIKEAEQLFKVAQRILASASNGVGLHLFTRFPENRARMSGTSMAAPAIAGLVAKRLIARAEREGVPLNEVYGRPHFTPPEVIAELIASGEKVNIGSNVTVTRIGGDEVYARSGEGDLLDRFLEKSISSPDDFFNNFLAPLLPKSLLAELGPSNSGVTITDPNQGPLMRLVPPRLTMGSQAFGCEPSFLRALR